MIVIAMIGILTALVAPLISESIAKHRATSELTKLRDALIQSRNLARLSRLCVKVEVVPGERKISATPYRSCDPLQEPISERKLEFRFAPIVSLSVFSTADGTLLFNDEGGTTEDAPATIEMTSAYANRRYAVLPGIGSVREQR